MFEPAKIQLGRKPCHLLSLKTMEIYLNPKLKVKDIFFGENQCLSPSSCLMAPPSSLLHLILGAGCPPALHASTTSSPSLTTWWGGYQSHNPIWGGVKMMWGCQSSYPIAGFLIDWASSLCKLVNTWSNWFSAAWYFTWSLIDRSVKNHLVLRGGRVEYSRGLNHLQVAKLTLHRVGVHLNRDLILSEFSLSPDCGIQSSVALED